MLLQNWMLTVSLMEENIGPKENKQLRDWLAVGVGDCSQAVWWNRISRRLYLNELCRHEAHLPDISIYKIQNKICILKMRTQKCWLTRDDWIAHIIALLKSVYWVTHWFLRSFGYSALARARRGPSSKIKAVSAIVEFPGWGNLDLEK